MNTNKRVLLFVGIGCGLVAIVCVVAVIAIMGLSIGGAMALSQPLADVGDTFMAALKDGDYVRAFSLCSPQLQRQIVNPQAMQFMIENGKTKPIKWSFSSRSVVNENGVLEGPATLTGGAGRVRLLLVKVSDSWKVSDAALKLK